MDQGLLCQSIFVPVECRCDTEFMANNKHLEKSKLPAYSHWVPPKFEVKPLKTHLK